MHDQWGQTRLVCHGLISIESDPIELESDPIELAESDPIEFMSNSIQKFELLALNPHWADIRDCANSNCTMIGAICGLNRWLR